MQWRSFLRKPDASLLPRELRHAQSHAGAFVQCITPRIDIEPRCADGSICCDCMRVPSIFPRTTLRDAARGVGDEANRLVDAQSEVQALLVRDAH